MSKMERKEAEEKNVAKLIGVVEGLAIKENVVSYRRIGKYEKGKDNPLRVTLSSPFLREMVLKSSKKLQQDPEGKLWKLRRDLSKDDREVLKKNLEIAKTMNEGRSEEERNAFFYKVRGLSVPVKWKLKKQ